MILWIYGAAGSGKTALSKMIYRRRSQPEYKISCSAWVTVTEKFDYARVLEDILRQVVESTDISNYKQILEDILRWKALASATMSEF
jgi:Cdc6-like AAA superfamily ATPase